jgi:hypothetical protein
MDIDYRYMLYFEKNKYLNKLLCSGVWIMLMILFIFLAYDQYILNRLLWTPQPVWVFNHISKLYEKGYLAIHPRHLYGVTLVRNKAQFLAEWIDFHVEQGFNQFLIYNHNVSDYATTDILLPYVQNKLVILIDALSTFPNQCSYNDQKTKDHWFGVCQNYCFTQSLDIIHNQPNGLENSWIFHFDVDEFVFTQNKRCIWENLILLNANVDVIYIEGLNFGTSNFSRNDEFHSVIQTHFWRAGFEKSIRKKFINAKSSNLQFIKTHDAYCITYLCSAFHLGQINDWVRLHHYAMYSIEEALIKSKTNHNFFYSSVAQSNEKLAEFNVIYDDTIRNAVKCESRFY